MRFKAKRYATLEQVRAWVSDERKRHTETENLKPASSAQLVANAALSLLNPTCYLLKRQLDTQAETFEEEGGFTERLYRIRTANRNKPN
ncbi:MAG TPA: four helix bundle suffix domain-containing protein [Verrucomicrobiae bacterium]|nr:four helix bundle suffix domain-containing protein [Verrucomicrobiae bacterium]